MARSRAGDTDAFRALFERKHRRVYLIAYQILGNPSQAEEVVQDAFLALWQHLDRYRPRFAVDTWLSRIATNRAIDVWRSQRRERQTGEGWESQDAEAAGRDGTPQQKATARTSAPGSAASGAGGTTGDEDPESMARWREVQAIWDELAELLPPQQRAAFILREIEGFPTREVAATIGCGTSTVRSHIAEARRTLQAALIERYPELAG
jgi:RNA polymerase sigma-70 factor (ECF subfamily)